jgi:penicillin-binding protein 1A
MWKALLLGLFTSIALTVGGAYLVYKKVESSLPPLKSVEDYKPLLITEVFDRKGVKVAEWFHERRRLVPVDQIPKHVIQAFLAAEDGEFYHHKGVNWLSILRAAWANLKAGDKVQGASTITQQLVKTLFLSPEKTFERKFKEILLAQKLEENLSKDDILYLYLNQIFFGQNSYGIAMAAETYFRKAVHDLTIAEAALLAGLPKAPTKFNPLKNPSRAKERQVYVLRRMTELGFISESLAKQAEQTPLNLYFRESFVPQAHGAVETARLLLLKSIPEEDLVTKGYRVDLTIDLDIQTKASEATRKHLRELDKRQGYRGPLRTLKDLEEQLQFLKSYYQQLVEDRVVQRILLPDGSFQKEPEYQSSYPLKEKGLPSYLKLGEYYQAVVTKVDDKSGLAYIQVAEVPGVIDIDTSRWARPFDTNSRGQPIQRWSQVLKPLDVIEVKLIAATTPVSVLQAVKKRAGDVALDHYAYFHLEQEPQVESASLVLDLQQQEVLAMVTGYDFARSKFNRILQAKRQTGSSFKAFVYAAALDNGYRPNSVLLDAPLVYENQNQGPLDEWKPTNHAGQFEGEILLRNALVRSLNIPAVRVMEDIGVSFAKDYVRRLGVFSPLNEDFTLVLGSSGVTLYEMTRGFAVFARGGRAVIPSLVRSVTWKGQEVPGVAKNLDDWFTPQSVEWAKEWEERRQKYLQQKESNSSEQTQTTKKILKVDEKVFFEAADQWISPQTAYLMTDILKGVIRDPNGTAARYAGELPNIELAGKTGSSNDYIDGWFLGYSPQYVVGTWVGFDQEKSLGPGEVGGRTALPIWVDVMKYLHESDKDKTLSFPIPEGIEMVTVDYYSGKILEKPKGSRVLRLALRREDVEQVQTEEAKAPQENPDYLKQEFEE